MKFVFFRFQRTEKMDSVMKGRMGTMPPQNFWVRTAPGPPVAPRAPRSLRPALISSSQLCPYKRNYDVGCGRFLHDPIKIT